MQNEMKKFNAFFAQTSNKTYNIQTGKFSKQAQKSLFEKGLTNLTKTYLPKKVYEKIRDDEEMQNYFITNIKKVDDEIEIIK